MVTSGQPRSELLDRRLSVRRLESVPATATVRHVDQLEENALKAFLELVSGSESVPATATSLEPGEVLVFTDYYRIERR